MSKTTINFVLVFVFSLSINTVALGGWEEDFSFIQGRMVNDINSIGNYMKKKSFGGAYEVKQVYHEYIAETDSATVVIRNIITDAILYDNISVEYIPHITTIQILPPSDPGIKENAIRHAIGDGDSIMPTYELEVDFFKRDGIRQDGETMANYHLSTIVRIDFLGRNRESDKYEYNFIFERNDGPTFFKIEDNGEKTPTDIDTSFTYLWASEENLWYVGALKTIGEYYMRCAGKVKDSTVSAYETHLKPSVDNIKDALTPVYNNAIEKTQTVFWDGIDSAKTFFEGTKSKIKEGVSQW